MPFGIGQFNMTLLPLPLPLPLPMPPPCAVRRLTMTTNRPTRCCGSLAWSAPQARSSRKRRNHPSSAYPSTGWRSMRSKTGHPGHEKVGGWLRDVQGLQGSPGSVRVPRAIVLPNAACSTAQGQKICKNMQKILNMHKIC